MDPVKVLIVVESLMSLLMEAGMNINRYLDLRRRAEAENRSLTREELESVLEDAREQVARLPGEDESR